MNNMSMYISNICKHYTHAHMSVYVCICIHLCMYVLMLLIGIKCFNALSYISYHKLFVVLNYRSSCYGPAFNYNPQNDHDLSLKENNNLNSFHLLQWLIIII